MANNIVDTLNRIDASAAGLLNQVDDGKKHIDEEMAQKTKEFEAAIEEETNKQIEAIRAQYEKETNDQLAKDKQEADDRIKKFQDYYDANHKAIVDKLFHKIIEES